MPAGFRKSLFGFNQDDVYDYIKQLNNQFSKKETVKNEEIAKLKDEISSLNKEHDELEREKALLEEKLEEYGKRTAEMERLSENIGKLYLVAQTNAKTIMKNAEDNSAAINSEIAENVKKLDNAHSTLNELKNGINSLSSDFSQSVGELLKSLDETKEKLSSSEKNDSTAKNEFAEMICSLEK